MDYETARNMPAIDAYDPEALAKVRARVEAYREEYERRKNVNAYYRRFKSLRGCPGLSREEAAHMMDNLEVSCKGNPIPYGKKSMDSILGSIRSFEKRIAALERWQKEPAPEGWRFEGGEVVINTKALRVQVIFDTKADIDTVFDLRENGFVWEPDVGVHGVWQKVLNERSIEVARELFSKKS